MNNDLIRQFVEQELNSGIRDILRAALQDRANSEKVLVREFEFNCFDVALNFDTGVATIQDVLASGAESSVEVPILDFIVLCGLSIS